MASTSLSSGRIGHDFPATVSYLLFKIILFNIGLLHGLHDLLLAQPEFLSEVIVELILHHLSIVTEVEGGA